MRGGQHSQKSKQAENREGGRNGRKINDTGKREIFKERIDELRKLVRRIVTWKLEKNVRETKTSIIPVK